MDYKKRFKLISCEIMFREVCLCASKSINIIDITFMPKGLHDIGENKMYEKLQHEINTVDVSKYDAILLCYGLCNNGVRNLHAKIPLVIPRAHDCITLLLGSKNRYKEYFDNNPSTFFKSSGWIERDVNPNDTEGSVTSQLGIGKSYDEYVELYGEDNADYLKEILGNWTINYKKVAYIDTETGNVNLDKKISRKLADNNHWDYEEVQGSIHLILQLLDGEWTPEDFLVVPPNNKIEPSNEESIILFTPISDMN